MRYSTLISTVLTVLTMACGVSTPRPSISPEDCTARLDCRVVNVVNDSKNDVDVRINGVKYGFISAYSNSKYSLYVTQLIHGNCAVVSTRTVNTGLVTNSDEQCIKPDEYFEVSITSTPRYVWLTPYRIR